MSTALTIATQNSYRLEKMLEPLDGTYRGVIAAAINSIHAPQQFPPANSMKAWQSVESYLQTHLNLQSPLRQHVLAIQSVYSSMGILPVSYDGTKTNFGK
ncbi:hypothetical protein SNOG_15943 [Parastagonospora nodorum SN15]|uniref:Uncharacterized protein n=1 Tax=Phaeosphaeria nodorum (strain SN15 / ATCC MYA-4574 / FGSC 10173) TaxID=321614 RepID=Q0TXC0_PHANO|nr:hypothetical protein SNOG_15943 [Parastagonospora nodorum SN15]EAT76781.1 hypothetical protein SNOG_15943 [Parastagonospora nodorum SN15]